MNLIKRCVLPLCLLSPALSSAVVTYSYEADCVERRVSKPFDNHTLPCSDKIRGLVELPGFYAPGTEYFYFLNTLDRSELDSKSIRFTMIDDYDRLNRFPLVYGGLAELPLLSGPGRLQTLMVTTSFIDVKPDGSFRWATEYPVLGDYYYVTGTNAVFTLLAVPEPSNFVLASVGLLTLCVVLRRSSRP